MSATAAVDARPSIAATKEKTEKALIRYPFWLGGAGSCTSACMLHPLDVVKVRLQTQRRSGVRLGLGQMFVHVVKSDGILGLYSGLTASLLRQCTYGLTRFAVYGKLKETFIADNPKPSFPSLLAMASVSGLVAGIAGNPADLLNVRMQNDGALPPEQRRRYKHVFDGLFRMIREEGVGSLFRGVWAHSTRGIIMTASQLGSYDFFKQQLMDRLSMTDSIPTHFSASLMAGFTATTIASPVDVIKVRLMSATTKQSALAIVTRMTANEGLRWMFKGWVPSFMRLGPHTILTFIFFEQYRKAYRKFYGYE
ncbi:hypothetical protein M409DRAFT_22354 [Zasmidium cellare ATCC 36951]|uniref:Mitochondrial carrier n=1 Tax=Zasmidium cellare ATCC 36951 TaxID=1080233 RepID=A0A6A6CP72_ZASCE|nr:uncharacterized protein M409DRAFT_22354 [Zasmidium cellare ATCC 36951]KAF2167549.1 hypothetical protein M409DRAFT_22354 [Zasmidium cellare ATCC 36951]